MTDLIEILRVAVGKSECVALFVIVLLLLAIHHIGCLRRVELLNRRFCEHAENCDKK